MTEPVAPSESGSSPPWQRLFDAALDAMLIVDDQGVYVEVNKAACALLELPRQALVGRQIADFLLPGTDFERDWQAFIAAGQVRGEQQLRLDSGAVKTVEFAATAHIYPSHHLSILRDITERKDTEAERDALSHELEQWVISSSEKLQRTEAALRLQQQRIDSILNSLECVVWSIHPVTLETIYVNTAVERLYGYSVEDFLIDKSLWFSLIHPEDEPLLRADIKAVMDDVRIDREYRILRADGQQCWVHGQARLMRNAAGQATRIDGTTTD
ncbi:MAG: PAS domain S-box protein, partial [Nodosilinea sp.]